MRIVLFHLFNWAYLMFQHSMRETFAIKAYEKCAALNFGERNINNKGFLLFVEQIVGKGSRNVQPVLYKRESLSIQTNHGTASVAELSISGLLAAIESLFIIDIDEVF